MALSAFAAGGGGLSTQTDVEAAVGLPARERQSIKEIQTTSDLLPTNIGVNEEIQQSQTETTRKLNEFTDAAVQKQQKACTDSGGTWNNKKKRNLCSCDKEKGLTDNVKGFTCKCSDDDYEFKDNKCVKKSGEEKAGENQDKNKDNQDENVDDESQKSNVEQKAIDEKAYDEAKANETSLKNRMVSGVTMAATGVGGMQLAQGFAEQNADKNAESDMAEYLGTFECKIGNGGKSYTGGTPGIEVPGANQLTKIYQEYDNLATDLKKRKTALGMKPGIESQVVLDKSNMGLYDDVGHGIENGTYASLYRASKGNENDITKLSGDSDTSQTRVKGGGIATGAGALFGAVGGNVDFSSWGSGASNALGAISNGLGGGINIDEDTLRTGYEMYQNYKSSN